MMQSLHFSLRTTLRWIAGIGFGIGSAFGQVPSHSPITIDEAVRAVVRGNVHPALRRARLIGRAPAGMPMQRMILSLKGAPESKLRLEQFLAAQEDPGSPEYHHWLSPEQFGDRFGPKLEEVDTVSAWLQKNGFAIDEISPSRMSITFSGTRESVEWAFRTAIMDYELDGQIRHANATDPSIPAALSGIVNGVVTLHNIPRKSFLKKFPIPLSLNGTTPQVTIGTDHYLGPGDFGTIYHVGPLYSAGLDGKGVSVAIVGRSNIHLADINAFRNDFGLPFNPPSVLLNGPDPGVLSGSEEDEAVLDVTWSGAVAKRARIQFVVSKSTLAADGVDLSAQYIVNHNLAPILSVSFGLCEEDLGASGNLFYNQLWAQAAAEGITVCVASGDNGPAGCDSATATTATRGAAVSGLASTPYNVAVGGTEFDEGSGSYWGPSVPGNTYAATALSYIPELPWDESALEPGGSGLWSGGGGASTKYAKPLWQVSPGVPSDSKRDVPDVALNAAIHDGNLAIIDGGTWVIGGTSASAPAFSGLMALVVQQTGRQGNANRTLYRLGNLQYGSSGAAVFHDITSGNTNVPGLTGFSGGTGYDLATGLGSVDATALVNHWNGVNTLALSINPKPAMAPVRGTIPFTASATGMAAADVRWSVTGGSLSSTSGSPVLWTAPATAGNFTITATNALDPTMADAIPITVKSLDLDEDGITDRLDASILAWAFGAQPGDANWVEAADLNGDRIVDDQDLNLFISLSGF